MRVPEIKRELSVILSRICSTHAWNMLDMCKHLEVAIYCEIFKGN